MVKIDDKLDNLKQVVLHMATLINTMYTKVYTCLETMDVDKALEVIKMDEFVNRCEEDVNDTAIECLALLSPVASDLRKVIAAIKITSDLERIGDYSKNIASFVIKNDSLDDETKTMTKEIMDEFLTMLDHAMDAYAKEDSKWAMQIPSEDEIINKKFKEISDRLRTSNNYQIDEIINIAQMIRNIERAGDHTKNICEHIIYQTKGQHIEFD
ncbi:MAG: phosphate signaling complex protein PhoU [Erysipelotrichaceae bacterium]|nr:phosphate signaling complex protein PhoU [Erysipelotrichaceae bacterium]MDY5251767.1 phosphate signaling complex protein PhoU [Erysipelotrichaceae bacterium]